MARWPSELKARNTELLCQRCMGWAYSKLHYDSHMRWGMSMTNVVIGTISADAHIIGAWVITKALKEAGFGVTF